MGPQASLVYYPVNQPMSGGFSHLGYILAAALIILTVLSYQKMMEVFPRAGSAYTYASKGINGKVGFMVGWVLILDYLLTPMFLLGLGGTYMEAATGLPLWAFIIIGAVFITFLCSRGIATSVKVQILIGAYVIGYTLFIWYHAVNNIHDAGMSIIQPDVFYDPNKIIPSGVVNVGALALLSFVGFDGITTLAEESKITGKKFRYTIMVAVLIDAVFQIFGAYILQAAQDYATMSETELATAYQALLIIWTSPGLVAILTTLNNFNVFAVAIAATTATARILYSMGRDKVMPQIFARLHPKYRVPTYSVLFIGAISLIGALVFKWETIAEFVAFGACWGFLMVNVSVIVYFWFKQKERKVMRNLILPAIAICGILWIIFTLSALCLTVGTVWTLIGLTYVLVRYKSDKEFRANIDQGDMEM
jgi:amino acid transporter